MFIPDPGSWFFSFIYPGSRIQQPQKQRRGKKLIVLPFFVSQLTIIKKLNFFFNWFGKKFEPIYERIIVLFNQKLSLSSQTYRFGIRDPEKTYSGSRNQGWKRHRIQDPDPQHWLYHYAFLEEKTERNSKFQFCLNYQGEQVRNQTE
jgi:hypothetical protein